VIDEEDDDALDATTLGPETSRVRTPPRAMLRLLFAAGAPKSEVFALAQGDTQIGRSVDAVFGIRVDADPRMSRHHDTVQWDGARARIKSESKHAPQRNGAAFEDTELADGDVIQLGDSFFVFRLVPTDVVDGPVPRILGVSPAAVRLRSSVHLIGPTAASVLILGPTGAGKDVMARALHDASARRGPFVAVNTTAIPESLAESTLFGHVAGAFTGASADHPGTFKQAHGGTLFLDEIGDLPLALQPKLLRALDERRITPVGARETVPVDVRIVAATNADLEARVHEGKFRGDLFARLAEITVRMPPLVERREDVLPLVVSALPKGHAPIEAALARALLLYDWPYNVREVMKVATELSVRGAGRELLTLDLVEERLRSRPSLSSPPSTGAGGAITAPRTGASGKSETVERDPVPDKEQLVALLAKHAGVISEVARATGRSRKQVYRWLDQHGLRDRAKGDAED
jgi:DNA-binding NtrC family response regulator